MARSFSEYSVWMTLEVLNLNGFGMVVGFTFDASRRNEGTDLGPILDLNSRSLAACAASCFLSSCRYLDLFSQSKRAHRTTPDTLQGCSELGTYLGIQQNDLAGAGMAWCIQSQRIGFTKQHDVLCVT